MHLFPRSELHRRLTQAMSDPGRYAALLHQSHVRRQAARTPTLAAPAPAVAAATPASETAGSGDLPIPAPVLGWLARLAMLQGVPFQYLVPDEGMLPPESIRFFHLNASWIDALLDGALSLGRNLTAPSGTAAVASPIPASLVRDAAVRPGVMRAVRAEAGASRRRDLPLPAAVSARSATPPAGVPAAAPVTGFLLRSSVVAGYPGLGVNAYKAGGTPSDAAIALCPILRFEQLGPSSGVLLCLIDGDPVQIDIHEPPEGLHYGLDSYDNSDGQVSATKSIRTFTRSTTDGCITMSRTPEMLDPQAVAACFRSASPRVLTMCAMAALIGAVNNGASLDSAEMGFEMTEGVGQVSFKRPGG